MNTRFLPVALLLALLLAGTAAADETQPPPAAETAAPAPKAVKGKVLETMSGAGYTYMLVEEGQEKTWVAIPESKVVVGQTVDAQPGMVMKGFKSEALNKTFDAVVFSSGLVADAAAAPAIEGGTPTLAAQPDAPVDEATLEAMSGGSARAVVPAKDELKIEKAEGETGRTVAQCFAEKEQLNGKTVRVRGKVVKFTPQIMGKNWIHLQDGSGDPMKNTHDLVITTAEKADKDAVVVVEGVLNKDKDFGAGYRYEAIIEDAKISK